MSCMLFPLSLLECVFVASLLANVLLIAHQLRKLCFKNKSLKLDASSFQSLWSGIVLEDFLANLPGHTYWVDTNNVVLGCNEHQAGTIGYKSQHDIVGRNVSEFLDPVNAPKILANNHLVFQFGRTIDDEERLVDITGKIKIYFSKKVPLKDAQGNITGLLGVSLDITAQKELDEKLLEIERLEKEKLKTELQLSLIQKKFETQEKNFYNILSIVPGHVYWKSLKGEYLGCNQSQAIDAGFSSVDEMIGLTDFEMPWTADAEALRRVDRQVAEEGLPVIAEEPCFLGDGRYTTWLSKKEPLKDENGNIIGIIGTSIDITAQKENERLELEKTDQKRRELELKLTAQEEFRKIVLQANHDIASPLLVLDLFANKYLEIIPEEQRNSVRNSINRIRGIASSMLIRFDMDDSNSGPDAVLGTHQTTKSDMLILPALLESINEKRFEYSDPKICIYDNIDRDTYFAFLSLDSHAFKRLISNIINNSVDALAKNSAPSISIDLKSTAVGGVSITVSDDGEGMQESVRQKILNNMTVTSGKKSGHGIGYVQIRRALALHDATLSIESAENIGTKVTLTFPRLPLPDYLASCIELCASDTVVVVDDDPSIHEAWDLRFNRNEIVVKHFTQGNEAVKYISSLTKQQRQELCLLVDYEFQNQNINGVDIINKFSLKTSVLVTGHYPDQDLIAVVKNSGIKMLPKILASRVPILIRPAQNLT